LLCDLRHFAVEARLIPLRRLTFNARIMVYKSQMGIFELLHPNLERGFSDRSAGTEEKSDCTDCNDRRCQEEPRIFMHNCFKWSLMTLKANRKEKSLAPNYELQDQVEQESNWRGHPAVPRLRFAAFVTVKGGAYFTRLALFCGKRTRIGK